MKSDKTKGLAKVLAYARLAIAGGIGGVAVYNTYILFTAVSPTPSIESASMTAGAVVAATLAKILHVV